VREDSEARFEGRAEQIVLQHSEHADGDAHDRCNAFEQQQVPDKGGG
jgi:hypothetical protein